MQRLTVCSVTITPGQTFSSNSSLETTRPWWLASTVSTSITLGSRRTVPPGPVTVPSRGSAVNLVSVWLLKLAHPRRQGISSFPQPLAKQLTHGANGSNPWNYLEAPELRPRDKDQEDMASTSSGLEAGAVQWVMSWQRSCYRVG